MQHRQQRLLCVTPMMAYYGHPQNIVDQKQPSVNDIVQCYIIVIFTASLCLQCIHIVHFRFKVLLVIKRGSRKGRRWYSSRRRQSNIQVSILRPYSFA